jgi:predicted neutral ceramidase superfamily lipid hydrolase
MNNRQWQKGSYTWASIIVQACTLLMWLNITQDISKFLSIIHFTNSMHPTSKTMCGPFEQDTRLVKWLSLKTTSLYVVVCTIAFDTQYWLLYSRGLLNVNTMSNLVFIRQRGTISKTSYNEWPCSILPSMTRYFLLNNCLNSHWGSLQKWPYGSIWIIL